MPAEKICYKPQPAEKKSGIAEFRTSLQIRFSRCKKWFKFLLWWIFFTHFLHNKLGRILAQWFL